MSATLFRTPTTAVKTGGCVETDNTLCTPGSCEDAAHPPRFPGSSVAKDESVIKVRFRRGTPRDFSRGAWVKVIRPAVSSKGNAAADSEWFGTSCDSLEVPTTVPSNRLRRRRNMINASTPQRITKLVTETMAARIAGEMWDSPGGLVLCASDDEVWLSSEAVGRDAGTLSPEIRFYYYFISRCRNCVPQRIK